MIKAAATSLLVLLTGCAAPTLYQWGSYDALLYRSYKDPATAQDFRVRLESHIRKMEQGRLKVAPGLYAELGTAYLHQGDRDQAAAWYGKERDAWPESKGLMDAMIANLQQRKAAPTNGSPS